MIGGRGLGIFAAFVKKPVAIIRFALIASLAFAWRVACALKFGICNLEYLSLLKTDN